MNYIWIRTSTDEQNPKLQLDDCISINKYGEYKVLEEQQSAWKDKERIVFESLRDMIKKREVEHLICWDLDRLYRNRLKLIAFFKLCKLCGCKIHSFRQTWLEELNDMPEPFGEMVHDMMLQIMGWMGEDESKKKSERIKNAIRKEEGKRTKSYKGNVWGRKGLSKETVKEIFEKHKLGMSIREISQSVMYWDKNRNQKFVSKSAVHKCLQQGVYHKPS